MFLVVTARGGQFDFPEELPDGVIAVDSTAYSVKEQMTALMAGNHPLR
jgi:hypothetical protein